MKKSRWLLGTMPHAMKRRVIEGAILGVIVSMVSLTDARTLECGTFDFPHCSGPDDQFDRTFKPEVGFGGFGGASCLPTRTPVVFIHGNADRATNWDSDITGAVGDFAKPADSVYDAFKAGGYHDCELFGITDLTTAERDAPQSNYHSPETYRVIVGFIEAVKSYTGKPQVDVVAHSLGVSMTIAALTYSDSQPAGIRRGTGAQVCQHRRRHPRTELMPVHNLLHRADLRLRKLEGPLRVRVLPAYRHVVRLQCVDRARGTLQYAPSARGSPQRGLLYHSCR